MSLATSHVASSRVVSGEVVRLCEEQVLPVVGLLESGLCLYLTVMECLEDIGADRVVTDEPDPSAVPDEAGGSRGGGYESLGGEGIGGPVIPDGLPEHEVRTVRRSCPGSCCGYRPVSGSGQ